jgi:hypothetical protein
MLWEVRGPERDALILRRRVAPAIQVTTSGAEAQSAQHWTPRTTAVKGAIVLHIYSTGKYPPSTHYAFRIRVSGSNSLIFSKHFGIVSPPRDAGSTTETAVSREPIHVTVIKGVPPAEIECVSLRVQLIPLRDAGTLIAAKEAFASKDRSKVHSLFSLPEMESADVRVFVEEEGASPGEKNAGAASVAWHSASGCPEVDCQRDASRGGDAIAAQEPPNVGTSTQPACGGAAKESVVPPRSRAAWGFVSAAFVLGVVIGVVLASENSVVLSTTRQRVMVGRHRCYAAAATLRSLWSSPRASISAFCTSCT